MRYAAARNALTLQQRALLARAVLGCCGNDEWRGHLCAYHSGYADGLADAAGDDEQGMSETIAALTDDELIELRKQPLTDQAWALVVAEMSRRVDDDD